MNPFLERSIRIKLLKLNNEPLTITDFQNVTDLGLDNLTFSNKPKDIDLSELSNFLNIKNLTLQHFDISERELEILQQLDELEYLKLVSCKIGSKQTFKFNKLQTLEISTSDFKFLDAIQCPKNVIINGIEGVVDLGTLQGIEAIEQLSLTNIKKVLSIKNTNQMYNLKYLNLDGSKVDNKHIVEELGKKINVSQEEESLMIR